MGRRSRARLTALAGGRVVYVCGENLCAVDPSTGGQQQITTDGRGYRPPTSPPTAPPWRPTSKLVAHNETDYTPRGAPGTGQLYDGGNGTSFTGAGAMLSGTYDIDRDLHGICRVDVPAAADQPCTELFNGPNPFTSFDSSPDGQWVAATVTPETPEGAPPAPSSVQLFSTSAGTAAPAQPTRVVADNAVSPTFSPDGSWLAYASADGWIYAVPAGGGTPVKLVQGVSPAWGGGAIDAGKATGKAQVVKPKGVVKATVTVTGAKTKIKIRR